GAFDTPEQLPPHIQYGLDRKLPFVDGLAQLPTRPPEDDAAAEAFLASVVSRQHPDHDTAHWPA
ncbi:GFA family protein, partial [Xanthomonas perforans]|nr:GFA family protein [Xanthomonas perforans]